MASETQALPFYLEKAIELGLLEFNETKLEPVNAKALEHVVEVARIIDKLQPTSALEREDTLTQEAIVLTRLLSGTPDQARQLWSTLRTAFGLAQGQTIPNFIWSDDRFRAIAKEIDLTFMGERSSQLLSRESLIINYSALNPSSRSVDVIDFNQTITELSDANLIDSYGDPVVEWETALDILKQVRARAIYSETLHNAKQNIKADVKLEQAFQYLQERAIEGVGMMRGVIGAQGQSTDILQVICGDPGSERKNWIDHILSAERPKKPASTGINAIDIDIDGGVQFPVKNSQSIGRMFTLAARTGCGKTSFGCQIASALACEGLSVGYLSIELDAPEIEARLQASLSRKLLAPHGYHWRSAPDRIGYVTVGELLTPNHQDRHDIANVIMALSEKIVECPGRIRIEAPWMATADTVVSSIKAMKAKDPELKAVVLDHFHCLSKHKKSAKDNQTMLEERAHKLMDVTKELGIDLFVLAQMNQIGLKAKRENLKQDDVNKPQLDQIRGTDVLSHLSHAVWLIQKHGYVEGEEPCDNKIEFWHTKVRSGQRFWEGHAPDEYISTVQGTIEMSLIQLDYATCSIRNDNTLLHPLIVKSRRKFR